MGFFPTHLSCSWLPGPVGVWTLALFRSGALAPSDSLWDAKMLGGQGLAE